MSKPSKYHDDFYDCECTVNASEDTREKLEADVTTLVDNIKRTPLYFSVCNDFGEEIGKLLNRQAAITEREGREAWHKAASGEIYQAKREADELREEVTRLYAKMVRIKKVMGE